MKKALLLMGMLAACSRPVLKLVPSKTALLANGYDATTLKIYGSDDMPGVELLGDHRFTRLLTPHPIDGHWETELEAGVMPGVVHVRVSSADRHVRQTITLTAQTTDSASDGTPDFLRLEDSSDRDAFRDWLTYLAEIQYFIPSQMRAFEISDCSGLVRYAYREALRDHDAAWLVSARVPVVRAGSSVRKYSFPHTPLGPNIFRIRGGTYSPPNLTDGTFREFADATTLRQFNTFFVSRDVARAEPGDLFFYRRETARGVTYHSMIFLGLSKVKPDGEFYVIYHTGPDGARQGEIRRLTLTQLLHFPNPQWQAITANPLFLGVYRWNILKASS